MSIRRSLCPRILWVAAMALLVVCGHVRAHTTLGHTGLSAVAVRLAGNEMPAFFSGGVSLIGDCSAEPDLWKTPTPSGVLKPVEYGEHFLDMEYLAGGTIPDSREEFYAWCQKKQLSPGKVGTIPYAIAEWTDRLTIALAEHRQWPDNKNIQIKCLVYAGILSHYSEDACLPLHATKDYDGRARSDGSSPKTGIHLKLDLLAEKYQGSDAVKAEASEVEAFENVKQAIANRLVKSNSEVGQIYELEKELPAADAPIVQGSRAEGLAKQIVTDASVFTARLYITAWHNSAAVKIDRFYHPSVSIPANGVSQTGKVPASDPNGQTRPQK
jgi:hypothetical protein